jgi:hypothetical protein
LTFEVLFQASIDKLKDWEEWQRAYTGHILNEPKRSSRTTNKSNDLSLQKSKGSEVHSKGTWCVSYSRQQLKAKRNTSINSTKTSTSSVTTSSSNFSSNSDQISNKLQNQSNFSSSQHNHTTLQSILTSPSTSENVQSSSFSSSSKIFTPLPLRGSSAYCDNLNLDHTFPQPSNLFSVSVSESRDSFFSKKRKICSNAESVNNVHRAKEVKLSCPISSSVHSTSLIPRKQKMEQTNITKSGSGTGKERRPFSIQSSSECDTVMYLPPSNGLSSIFDFKVLDSVEQIDKNNSENRDNHSKNVSQNSIKFI